MNKVTLVGRIGKDPEYQEIKGDTKLCKMSVATTRNFKGKDDVWKKETDWHQVTLWGSLAKRAVEHGRKGREVYLEGRLQYDSWEKEGVKQYRTSIVGNEMQLLGSGNSSSPVSDKEEGANGAEDDDDIPF
jgi:single-strand DNA-binding protein